jgi:hypothetical protein
MTGGCEQIDLGPNTLPVLGPTRVGDILAPDPCDEPTRREEKAMPHIAFHKRRKKPHPDVRGRLSKQAWKRNWKRGNSAMRGYRRGFRSMWRVEGVAKYLVGIKAKRPGKYHKWNQHGGEMWSLPCECRMMTETTVGNVLEKCGDSERITFDNLLEIRKMLSFTFQVLGGGRGENFACVGSAFDAMDADTLKPTFRSLIPKRMPSAAQLHAAFLQKWTAAKGPYILWCQKLVAAYDSFFNGLRPNIDFSKLKKQCPLQVAAVRHLRDLAAGWASTHLVGGRAKLSGLRKGRLWRRYICCHCPGGTHIEVPADVEFTIKRDGTLLEPPTWCTTCPLAANEVILRGQWRIPEERQSVYKVWGSSGRWTLRNVGNVPALAFEWLKIQGVDDDFDQWCGRKVYGRLCDELEIKYPESFPVHGDLPDTWQGHYQFGMGKTDYTNRDQPDDPRACIQSGRKIARWLGRGKVIPPPEPDENTVMLKAIFNMLKSAGVGVPSGCKKEEAACKKEEERTVPKRRLVTPWPKAKRPRLSEDGDDEYELP